MNSFQIPTVLVDRLGWMLLHSAWQFALIALLAGAIVRVDFSIFGNSEDWSN